VIRGRVVRDGEFHQTGNAIMLKLRRERDWGARQCRRLHLRREPRQHFDDAVDKLEWTGRLEAMRSTS
jgi:hypothetical protein